MSKDSAPHKPFPENRALQQSRILVQNRVQSIQRHRLITVFPQALSKAAPWVTSLFLLFLSNSFLAYKSVSLFCSTLLYVLLKHLFWNKIIILGWLLSGDKQEHGRQVAKFLCKAVFLFLAHKHTAYKSSAARAWASLHWHWFKRALPLSENWWGQVCAESSLASLWDSGQWLLSGLESHRPVAAGASSFLKGSVHTEMFSITHPGNSKSKLQHYFLQTLFSAAAFTFELQWLAVLWGSRRFIEVIWIELYLHLKKS